MLSLKEKNLSTLYAQYKDEVVNEAFEFLISDDPEKKSFVRSNITSSEWFDGYGVLKLASKLFDSPNGGWGRAKRNAITTWYLRRPLKVVKEQIAACPSLDKLAHKDIISFLHIYEICPDDESTQYFSDLVGTTTHCGTFCEELDNKSPKTGFWSFLSELFGG